MFRQSSSFCSWAAVASLIRARSSSSTRPKGLARKPVGMPNMRKRGVWLGVPPSSSGKEKKDDSGTTGFCKRFSEEEGKTWARILPVDKVAAKIKLRNQ